MMELLGTQYHNVTVDEALASIRSFLKVSGEGASSVFFLNADCLRIAQQDKGYRNILNSSQLVLSDGIGLRIATWLCNGRMADNCNGTDLSPKIMAAAAELGMPIYLFGAGFGVAEAAARNMEKVIPGLKVAGFHDGYNYTDENMIARINHSGAKVLFVAMGAPKQERWIDQYRHRLNVSVCIGVGALFDYLSGSIPRAPLWVRKLHMEWCWRIFIDPKRLAKRYLVDGVGFLLRVVWVRGREKLRKLT